MILIDSEMLVGIYKTLLRIKYGIDYKQYPAGEQGSDMDREVTLAIKDIKTVLLADGLYKPSELDEMDIPPPEPVYEYTISFDQGLPDVIITATCGMHAISEMDDDLDLWPEGSNDHTKIVSVTRGDEIR